jgi:hypothetical protein
MRKMAPGLRLAVLVLCLGLPAEQAQTIADSPAQSDSRGSVSSDMDDSEIFFQNEIPAAVRVASDADVVVLCLGEGFYT